MNDNPEIMRLLREIHGQQQQLLNRIDELEQTATRRGAVAGGVAGSISGAMVTIGIEMIKAKFGG
ncbi:MAG: hypothetical protein Q4B71_00395 [Cardiobacteriaceae bacterium]|nr:hypothetical protein [Cardiobacteriaceae bacterium]